MLHQAGALPVFDVVLPKLKDAKVFSKLCVGEVYQHVNLDEESSKLTKMTNPFAWCRWKRLPYGLKVSAGSFSASLKDIFSVVDDVVVAGCGQKMEQAQIDTGRS